MLPILVLISGAPGSGKTTLGRAVADALRVPHLNKDVIGDGIRLTRGPGPSVTSDAFEVFYGAARMMLSAGVSFVLDQTMYRGVSDGPEGERQLVPLGRAVHLHCMARNASTRWAEKVKRHPRYSDSDLAAMLDRIEEIQPLVRDPLDLGCPRIIVHTDDGYDPTVEELVAHIEQLATPGA